MHFKSAFISLILILFFSQIYFAFAQIPAYDENNGTIDKPIVSLINSKVESVIAENKSIDQLDASGLIALSLPVGINKVIGGTKYTICIDSSNWEPQRGWTVSAYASIVFPGSRKPIAFFGKNIGLGKGGLSTTSNTRIQLASEAFIDISASAYLYLPPDGSNYVEFDCYGFKSINLKGVFVFKEGFLIPDKDLAPSHPIQIGSNSVIASTKVLGTFEINAHDLNDIIISTSLTPFQVKGMEGITFDVKDAVVDMSDTKNIAGMTFPPDYANTYGPDIQLWRGFYLKDISVTLPKELNTKTGRASLKAQNLLIDDMGVSGIFTGKNLFDIESGSAGGWAFSLNTISVQLAHNNLIGGSMAGGMRVPFLGEDTLGYRAEVIQTDKEVDYNFLITTTAERHFNAIVGEMSLAPNSSFLFAKTEGKLSVTTNLNGKLTLKQKLLSISNIGFQELVLSTKAPYLLNGKFELNGDAQGKSVNFPVRIDELKLGIFEGNFSLGFRVALNFMEGKGLAASTSIKLIFGAENKQNGEYVSQSWKLKNIKIEKVTIDAKVGPVTMHGSLSIYTNDAIYGDGFRGSISVKLPVLSEIQANAYFGSKKDANDDFRYWHIDIKVPLIITIFGPLYINGIIGGASHHMIRQSALNNGVFKQLGEMGTMVAHNEQGNEGFSPSNEGAVYLPDKTVGMAFMAGVTLVVAQESVVSGDAMFEIAFNEGGGLKYIQFSGNAYILSKLNRERGAATPSAPFYASMNMLYDNENHVFHANLRVYVNLYGVLKGTGPNNLMGEMVIHIDPKDWYVYIGRPTQMNGVSVLGLLTAKSYFMVGTKIEDLPLPPPEVSELFAGIDLALMRDDGAAGSGRGFAFGLHFKAGVDASFGPIYFTLAIGAGTDVMLRNYGNTECKGRSGVIGADGWYASGQAYVFLKGDVGIQLKRRFSILKVGAAALLQAELPNPTWFRGGLAGEYSILGGLVSGHFNVMFEVGEKCIKKVQGFELGDISAISSIKPDNGGKEVNVFTAPQVAFNIPIDKELPMMNLNDELETYRVRMESLKVFNNNREIATEVIWNDKKDVVSLKTRDILPQKSNMKVSAKIYWEKKVSSGTWEKLKDAKGETDYELKESNFTTGVAPDNIPDENIAFSYPVRHQYNFYKNEYNQGYVKLKWGQDYLFKAKDSLTAYKFIGRYETTSGNTAEVPLKYESGNLQVTFAIPENLDNNSIYKMIFLKMPEVAGAMDRNAEKKIKNVGDKDNQVMFTENDLKESVAQSVEKSLYESDFRVSNYNSFSDKLNKIQHQQDIFNSDDIAQLMVLGKKLTVDETLDKFELQKINENAGPMVQLTATADNSWFKNQIYPLLYELYPQDASIAITNRKQLDELGLPPLKAVYASNDPDENGYMLSTDQVKTGTAPAKGGKIIIGYYLSPYVYYDFVDLRTQSAKWLLKNPNGGNEGVKRILSVISPPDLPYDDYHFDIKYMLPGIGKTTTEKQFNIRYR